jgi:PTS system ascorbate-specific IIA component
MVRLFIIAHAPLASALRAAAVHAFADTAPLVACYDVLPSATVEASQAEAAAALASLGEADVLILTDVFGATPCNIARQIAAQSGAPVLAGVNVPMLWRALNYRNKPIDEVEMLALAGATQGVMPVSVSRPQNQALKPAGHDPQESHHQQ